MHSPGPNTPLCRCPQTLPVLAFKHPRLVCTFALYPPAQSCKHSRSTLQTLRVLRVGVLRDGTLDAPPQSPLGPGDRTPAPCSCTGPGRLDVRRTTPRPSWVGGEPTLPVLGSVPLCRVDTFDLALCFSAPQSSMSPVHSDSACLRFLAPAFAFSGIGCPFMAAAWRACRS